MKSRHRGVATVKKEFTAANVHKVCTMKGFTA